MRFFVRASLLVGGLVMVVTGGVAALVRQPDPSWIVFLSDRSGPPWSYLYAMSPDGGDVWRITDAMVGEPPPVAWSPDGRQVVVESTHNGEPVPYVVSLLEHTMRLLTDEVQYPSSAVWSPDGAWIALVGSPVDSSAWVIFCIRPDGSDLHPLTPGEQDGNAEYRDLAWSPDGQWLAFSRATSTGQAIYRVRPDGSDLRQVAAGTGPVWSPDGTWIYYQGPVIDRGTSLIRDLFRIRPDGTDRQRLTQDLNLIWKPVFAPDGDWLAIVTAQPGEPWTLSRMRADGTDPQALMASVFQWPFSWSPDGEWIVYSTAFIFQNNTVADIYRIPARGGEAQRLTPMESVEHYAVWSPAIDLPSLSLLPVGVGLVLVMAGIAPWPRVNMI